MAIEKSLWTEYSIVLWSYSLWAVFCLMSRLLQSRQWKLVVRFFMDRLYLFHVCGSYYPNILTYFHLLLLHLSPSSVSTMLRICIHTHTHHIHAFNDLVTWGSIYICAYTYAYRDVHIQVHSFIKICLSFFKSSLMKTSSVYKH